MANRNWASQVEDILKEKKSSKSEPISIRLSKLNSEKLLQNSKRLKVSKGEYIDEVLTHYFDLLNKKNK